MAPLTEVWAGARRVLAVRVDNLGDVVMLTPALRSLRAALPDAELTLMASPAGSAVAPLLPWIDQVMTERVLWQDLGDRPVDPGRERALIRRIEQASFDLALIFSSFSQSPHAAAYACYLAGVPARVGQSKEFGGAVLSRALSSPPDSCHQVDRNLGLLEAIGLPLAGRGLELVVPDEARAAAGDLLGGVGVAADEPFVAMAPGASAPARRYHARRFGEVAKLLVAETGMPVVVVGSAGDQELAASVLDVAGPGVVTLCGLTSVPELAAVIRASTLVLTNDSGCMHLADAFARPVVVTFAGTDLEAQWGPRTSRAALLRRPTPCSPCYQIQCPFSLECLDLDPADVVAAAAEVLSVRSPDVLAAETLR